MNEDLKEYLKYIKETENEPLQGMKQFFDLRADSYEEHMQPWRSQYERVSKLLKESTVNLLDIGCGSGLELEYIFKRFPHLEVTAIDMSENLLSLLKEKFSDKNLKVIKGDYFAEDFGEGKFDAAIAFQTLHHYDASKKATLFCKINRSLKEGGIFIECDYMASCKKLEIVAFKECCRRRRRDNIADDEYVHFDTPLFLTCEIGALKEGGFKRVEIIGPFGNDGHTPILIAFK